MAAIQWKNAPTFEDRRADALAALAASRYATEVGGVVVAGAAIRTDRESQAQLSSAYSSLKSGLIPSTEWKGASGWMTVMLAELEPIAQAVAQHVASCFARERQLAEQIAAAQTLEALTAIAW